MIMKGVDTYRRSEKYRDGDKMANNSLTEEIEHCPECGKPMCFQRDTEDMPHEYDVCNDCGKHICTECSKIIDETEYCPECYSKKKEGEHGIIYPEKCRGTMEEIIGEGVHTGLRKWCESEASQRAWKAINDMPEQEWKNICDEVAKLIRDKFGII